MSADLTNITVQNFLLHLSQRNLEPLVALFSDKIDWFIPGDKVNAPWLGKRNSKMEVKHFFEMLWKNTEPLNATVENIFIEENQAIINGEFETRMLTTNKMVNSLFFIHMVVENEIIVKYRLLEDSYAVSESLKPHII